MPNSRRTSAWKRGKETCAALLALDMCGFSTDPGLNQLLEHRERFFQAVREAPSASELLEEGSLKIQFVGDELRLGFSVGIDRHAHVVREFIDALFANMAALNETAHRPTHLKGVVLEGNVTWQKFRGCDFFVGLIAVSCTDWLSCADKDQVLINSAFKDALEADGVPTKSLKKKPCPNVGDAYLLRP